MDFYINGKLIDVTLEDEKTVGDVLLSFAKTCEENRAATVAINLDGKNIPAENFDEIAVQPLKPDTRLELTVISEYDVIESLSSLKKPFTDMQKDIMEIPLLLQKGEDPEAHKIITALADLIDQFCHAASFSALFPERFNVFKIGTKTLQDFFEDFSKILGDFKNALEAKDTVTIGDIAEYEICPRIADMAEALSAIQ